MQVQWGAMLIGRPRSPLTALVLLIFFLIVIAFLYFSGSFPREAAASVRLPTESEAQAALPSEPEYQGIFTLSRSTNENLVVYEIRLGPEGFVEEVPIRARWVMLAAGGHVEELTALERRVYGPVVKGWSRDEVRFAVAAVPTRPIVVRFHEGRPRAMIEIGGVMSLLESIYISASGGLFPTVRYAELRGVSLQEGAEVRERVRP